MVSSQWERQNPARFNIAFVILLVSIMLIGFPAALFGLKGWSAVIASSIGFIAGVVLAFALLKRQANSLIRVLKFANQEIERDFRILFKDNHIQYTRTAEEDGFQYDFPGHALSMAIRRYALLNLGYDDSNKSILPATKITIGELTAENEGFARHLAALIDEMAKGLSET